MRARSGTYSEAWTASRLHWLDCLLHRCPVLCRGFRNGMQQAIDDDMVMMAASTLHACAT